MQIPDNFLEQMQDNVDFIQNPVNEVDIQFRGTRTNKKILNLLVGDFSKTNQILKVYEKIMITLQNFQSMQQFKKINVQFMPGDGEDKVKVIFDIQDKSPYFLTASQFVDRKGTPSVSMKVGLRNYFGFFEKIQFEYNKTLQTSKDMSYNFQINFPYLISLGNNFEFQYLYQNRILDANISEGNETLNLIYQKNSNSTFIFENSSRSNFISVSDQGLQQDTNKSYFQNEDFLTSSKRSFKYQRTHFDETDTFLGVQEGSKLNSITEQTVPYFSECQFSKFELNYKKFYPLRSFQNNFKHFRKMNIEQVFNIGINKAWYGTKLQINDCFNDKQMRGITELNHFIRSDIINNQNIVDNTDLFIKSTHKLNVYNYPGLKNAKILGFFYTSQGYFYRKRNNQGSMPFINLQNHFKEHFRNTAGFGIGFELGMGFKVECLYNILQQNRSTDRITNLEFRIFSDD